MEDNGMGRFFTFIVENVMVAYIRTIVLYFDI